MSSIWKLNSMEANGKEAEDGFGDGGILIHAETKSEVFEKLWLNKDQLLDYLPCVWDANDNMIDWSDFNTKESFVTKMDDILDHEYNGYFLIKFPSNKTL